MTLGASFSITDILYNGKGFLPPEVYGLPEDFGLVVEGLKFDQRADALQLSVKSISQSGTEDLHIYDIAPAFQSDGMPDQADGKQGIGWLTGPAVAGENDLSANCGAIPFYANMELLLRCGPSGGDDFHNLFKTTVVSWDPQAGKLKIRDPLPMQRELGTLYGLHHFDDTYVNFDTMRFSLPLGAKIVIHGYEYTITQVQSATSYAVYPTLRADAAGGTVVETPNWITGTAIEGAIYRFNRSYNVRVRQSETMLIGGLGLAYFVPIIIQFTMLHTFSLGESAFATAQTIQPPIVGAVGVVEQMPRLKDGSTRVIKLTLTHPLLKGAKLKLIAADTVKNKPATQALQGEVDFEAYAKSVELPVPDEA